MVICYYTGKVSDVSQSLFIVPNPDPNPAFVPDFVGDILKNANNEIKKACGDDQQCIYDAIQTDNLEVGLTTKSTQQNLTNEEAQFSKPKSIYYIYLH